MRGGGGRISFLPSCLTAWSWIAGWKGREEERFWNIYGALSTGSMEDNTRRRSSAASSLTPAYDANGSGAGENNNDDVNNVYHGAASLGLGSSSGRPRDPGHSHLRTMSLLSMTTDGGDSYRGGDFSPPPMPQAVGAQAVSGWVAAVVLGLLLVLSYCSFLWLGNEGLKYLLLWLACQAYFFGVLQRNNRGPNHLQPQQQIQGYSELLAGVVDRLLAGLGWRPKKIWSPLKVASSFRSRLATVDGQVAAHGGELEEGPAMNWEVGGRSISLRRTVTQYGEEEKDMVQELLDSVADKPIPGSRPWRLVRQRRGIMIWTSAVSNSAWFRIRGRMSCLASPAQLLSLLLDDRRIGEYDGLFDSIELVDRVDDRTSIRLSCYKAIWPTRPRDFLIKTTWEEFADGAVVIVTKSVGHPMCPESPTYIRGKMVCCGYLITPQWVIGGPDESIISVEEGTDGAVIGSEITMYAHTDLGGALPATVINRLCKKPAYRILRKIQKMIMTNTLLGPPRGLQRNRSSVLHQHNRSNSEDVLQGLFDDAGLEDQGGCPPPSSRRMTEDEEQRRRSFSRHSSGAGLGAGLEWVAAGTMPIERISPAYAMAEARRIMGALERMASDANLGWVQLNQGDGEMLDGMSPLSDPDMALYRGPVDGSTKKVRLGASTKLPTSPGELLGILLESAAMLGPDYIVDRQEVIETLSCGVGASLRMKAVNRAASAAADDTAIYWLSCTHKRQRISRDFVILRSYHHLPEGGGLIAYSSVDHPSYPPSPAFVRGKIDLCGFVIVPAKDDFDDPLVDVQVAEEDIPSGDDFEDEEDGVDRSYSSVTFFTHLCFSDALPALDDLQVSRYYIGPLHILKELKRVVNQTLDLGSMAVSPTPPSPRERSATESGAMGGVASISARSIMTIDVDDMEDLGPGSGEPSPIGNFIRCGSSVSALDLMPGGGPPSPSNATRLRVPQRRRAALRDLLALASDGECMDGPQADWQLVRKGPAIRLWVSPHLDSSWQMIRTRAHLDASPPAILRLLLDDSRIGEYDDLFDRICVIEPIDDNSVFKRTCYKPIWPTQPRDFSLLSSWGQLEDGSAYLVNRSVDHPDCPPVDGYVRGIVMMCGFLMVPCREPGASGCTLTVIVHTDLGGSLPAAILNKLSVNGPNEVTRKLQMLSKSLRDEEVSWQQ